MDVAQQLVRCVARAFHPTLEVLAVEALVQHVVLRDDEMAYLLKLHGKDTHRVCAQLRDARLLVEHTRPEVAPGKPRPTNKRYYYIDYRQAVDAIKWRRTKIDKDMQAKVKPQDEAKDYTCPQKGCGSHWSLMEVVSFDSSAGAGFLCRTCGTPLLRNAERETQGHQELSRMNARFKFITDLLQDIDAQSVPECTFDGAMARKREPVRDAARDAAAESVPYEATALKPQAVHGLANTGPKTMSVTISTGADGAEAEERRRREKHLADNALPQWYLDSSVPVPAAAAEPDSPKPSSASAALPQPQPSPLKNELSADGPGSGSNGAGVKREKRERDEGDGAAAGLDDAPAKKVKTEEGAVVKTEAEPDDEDEDDAFEFEDVI